MKYHEMVVGTGNRPENMGLFLLWELWEFALDLDLFHRFQKPHGCEDRLVLRDI